MTSAADRLLEAWSEVFDSPVATELSPGRIWQVKTANGERYVLKKVSTFAAPDPVRRFSDESRIVTHLLQRGLPVAVPVLANDGRICAVDEDGAPYAVLPLLPQGDPEQDPGLDPGLFANIGAAIARMHLALADCPFDVESWEVVPGTLETLWRTAQKGLSAAAFAQLSADVRPHWDSIIRALSATPQRVHGDVHGGNLLTDGRNVTGIIDVDHLPLAPRAFDLGYFMAFGAHWWLDGHEPPLPLEQTARFVTRHLLTGYDGVSRRTAQENADLPALALFAALGLLAYFIEAHDLVEESWLRTVHWIGGHFSAFRLPQQAAATGPPTGPDPA